AWPSQPANGMTARQAERKISVCAPGFKNSSPIATGTKISSQFSMQLSAFSFQYRRLGRRLEYQRAGGVDLAELHRVTACVVIIRPLILIVAGEDLAGLSDRDVQQRAIPIAQVRVHAHRGCQCAAGLLHGGAGPA